MPSVASAVAEHWLTRASRTAATALLAEQLHLPEPVAALLASRGVDTVEAARAFLTPEITQLHAPGLMLGMDAAVKRLRAALLACEPILIYGDYDVDGTVATVLLKVALERAAQMLGCTADVRYHIPHRIREGYGMQSTRLADAKEEGIKLVVSVDTGIRAFVAAEEAARLGLDLIVTDHHLPDAVEGVPRAVAVINPNQPGCGYPCKELCGAAVSFKLAQAVLEASARNEDDRQRLHEKLLPSFLKLLAIATIADAVPLTSENRVIAAVGLRELSKPSQTGLRTLMELASIDLTRPVSSFDVGFRIAPRINAAGRMDIASDVVEMFLTRDPAQGRSLAEKLHRLNDDRRATEAEALRAIEVRLEQMAAAKGGLAAALVLDDTADVSVEDDLVDERALPRILLTNLAVLPPSLDAKKPMAPWHRGVLGILASRVVDRTGHPALVITHELHEDGTSQAHGSGRSVEGFHLLDALTAVHAEKPIFTRFGGHAHAVGFSLPSANVADLRDRLAAYAAANQPSAPATPTRHCDLELRLGEITPDFLAAFEQLGPFGNGNPEPLFLTRNARLAGTLKIVKDRHLRLTVEDPEDGVRLSGMAWAREGRNALNFTSLARQHNWEQGSCLDLLYRLRRNWHPSFGGWEMEVVALRPASL